MPEFIIVTAHRTNANAPERRFAINVNHILMVEPSVSGPAQKGSRITMNSGGTRPLQHVVEENMFTLMEWLQ